jgi:hypothetical protein
VDGAPLHPGTARTTRHFLLQWRLQDCRPFGADGPVWNGDVEVDVRDDGRRYAALIRPQSLRVSGARGTVRLLAPFTATLE